jgi:uncharacterized protein YbjQ (UPF0145 family)
MGLFGAQMKKKSLIGGEEEFQQRNAATKEAYQTGKFKIVTTERIEGRDIKFVFGLVVCRSFNFENAFYGLIARAMDAGADAVIGYRETIAFHPEGDKHYSCYGTAVLLEPR